MESQNQGKTRVVRLMVELPESKSFVLVMSTAAGLRIMDLEPVTRGRENVIVARGVANILPLVPFYVLVKSF